MTERRHPCPYPDCAELNSVDSRFCARCGRPLNIKAMRAAESWRTGWWVLWPMGMIVIAPLMIWTIQRPLDWAPWLWFGFVGCAFAFSVSGSRNVEHDEQERLP